MTVFNRIRLLPLLVIISFLSFAIRIGNFSGDLRGGMAFAQSEVHDAEAPPLPEPPAVPAHEATAEAPADVPPPPATDNSKAESIPVPSAEKKPTDWQDAGDEEIQSSPAQQMLYKDLADRRREIDRREKALAEREALLKAGEREVDQKLHELTTVRDQIASLIKQQTDEQKTRVQSLVTIYEGMKAKDAARIFNTLDMDVLVSVLGRMSERKSSAILAEMNPDRARAVTILMAQQTQLSPIAADSPALGQ